MQKKLKKTLKQKKILSSETFRITNGDLPGDLQDILYREPWETDIYHQVYCFFCLFTFFIFKIV